jgi:hypothetical protein
MRPRKEIMRVWQSGWDDESERERMDPANYLVLETLLDIRDLLIKNDETVTVKVGDIAITMPLKYYEEHWRRDPDKLI